MKFLIAFLFLLSSIAVQAQCDTVTNVTITGITTTSATISAIPPSNTSNVTSYSFFVFKEGSGNPTTYSGNSTSPKVIAGLTPNTRYTLWFTTYCGTTQANQVGRYSFYTLPSTAVSNKYTIYNIYGWEIDRLRVKQAFHLPTHDTTSSTTYSDSSLVVLNPSDSTIYYKYKSKWRPLKTGDVTTELDPVWLAQKADYYTKSNLNNSGFSAVHWGNITNAPPFITTESDSVFLASPAANITNNTLLKIDSAKAKNISSVNVLTNTDTTQHSIVITLTDNSQFIRSWPDKGGAGGSESYFGTVTEVNTNNGTGITGGTFSSTGTLALDTASIVSTKAWLASRGYMSYTDSAAMLAPYLRKSDTLHLSNRINQRVKYTDTAAMLAPYLRSETYTGTVTSIATNNGTGITGGTITGTGTLAIDTANIIQTKADTRKKADSLAALINTKVNISDTAAMLSGYMREDTANGYSFSGWVEAVSNYAHVSEGGLINIGGDTLLKVVRCDTAKKHISNSALIAKSFSYDRGMTWTEPETVYNSVYDDRNLVLGRLDNGRIVVVFVRYGATDDTYPDVGSSVIYSDDNGATWSARTSISGSGIQPFGSFVKAGDGSYKTAIYGLNNVKLWSTTDGVNFTEQSTISTFAGYNETDIAYIGNNKMVALSRNENSDSTYRMFRSADNGTTWSYVGRSGLNDRILGASKTAPTLQYDSANNVVIAISYTRNHIFYENDNAYRDSVFIYIQSPDSAYNNLWKNNISHIRPLPNPAITYGYPRLSRLSDGSYAGIYTERRETVIDDLIENEIAWQYSFSLNYVTKYFDAGIINNKFQNLTPSFNPITKLYDAKSNVGFINAKLNDSIAFLRDQGLVITSPHKLNTDILKGLSKDGDSTYFKFEHNGSLSLYKPLQITTSHAGVKDTFLYKDPITGTVKTASSPASVGGSGTTNYLPKWTSSTTLGNSLLFDDGTSIISAGNIQIPNGAYISLASSSPEFTTIKRSGGVLFTTNTFETLLRDNGSVKLSAAYGVGAVTGTPAYNIAIDASGNVIETALPTAYTLPIASASVLGGVKVGSNLSINATTGVLDANAVTSIATNNGTGITGGTITSTGTLAIDTARVATRLRVQKGIDSVAALLYVRPYKVYTALMSQTGTGDPTATVLENTMGGTIVWSRTSTGQYSATLAGAFTGNKTFSSAIATNTGGAIVNVSSPTTTTGSIVFFITTDAGVPFDNHSNIPIEIRVYN